MHKYVQMDRKMYRLYTKRQMENCLYPFISLCFFNHLHTIKIKPNHQLYVTLELHRIYAKTPIYIFLKSNSILLEVVMFKNHLSKSDNHI